MDLMFPMPDVKTWNGESASIGPWLVEEKLNGICVRVTREGLFTRLRNKLKEIPHIQAFCDWLPPDTALDCELVYGKHPTEVKTAINEQSPDLTLTMFAVPFWKGEDLRTIDIEELEDIWDMVLEQISLAGVYCPQVPESRIYEVIDSEMLRLEAAREKLEGYVVKKAHYTGWYKIKPVKTVDCFVYGTTRSTSPTHFGDLKAIQVAVLDNGRPQVIASVGTGFTAEFRERNGKNLIGRVCEIQYDGLAQQGKLQFPRFLRWREDKVPLQCTMEQLR
jgi:ATP-dependent DNA ligase